MARRRNHFPMCSSLSHLPLSLCSIILTNVTILVKPVIPYPYIHAVERGWNDIQAHWLSSLKTYDRKNQSGPQYCRAVVLYCLSPFTVTAALSCCLRPRCLQHAALSSLHTSSPSPASGDSRCIWVQATCFQWSWFVISLIPHPISQNRLFALPQVCIALMSPFLTLAGPLVSATIMSHLDCHDYRRTDLPTYNYFSFFFFHERPLCWHVLL